MFIGARMGMSLKCSTNRSRKQIRIPKKIVKSASVPRRGYLQFHCVPIFMGILKATIDHHRLSGTTPKLFPKKRATIVRWVSLLALCLIVPVWHRGRASVYSSRFEGHKMANGRLYHARHKIVANRTLPLGADIVLCVRSKCTIVKVQDRGPFVKGRNFDISPAVAKALGVKPDGLITVQYKEAR